MPSTTINIQSGYSCAKSYGIDPTMPAILRAGGGVHEMEWRAFCDQVSTKLEPLNKLQRKFQIFIGLFVVAFIAVMIAFAIVVPKSIMSFKGENNGPDGAEGGTTMTSEVGFGGPQYLFIVLFLVPFLLMMGMIGVGCCVSKIAQETFKSIHEVCVEASKKNPLVSYHFKNDLIVTGYSPATQTHNTARNVYIEVSISDQTVNHSPTSYLTAGYPTVTSHTLGTDTPVERLEKLENMKHLLSNHEYEAKRSDILAAV
jgi:hypothetical protein